MISLIEVPHHRLIRVTAKNIQITRACMLAIHKVRSPLHHNIFPVVGDFSDQLFRRRSRIVLKNLDISGNQAIDIVIGEDYYAYFTDKSSTIYKIVETAPGRFGYLVHRDIHRQDIECINVLEVTVKPEYKYVGRISPQKDMLVQSLKDQGKISFKVYQKQKI